MNSYGAYPVNTMLNDNITDLSFGNVVGLMGQALAPQASQMISAMQQMQNNPNLSPQQMVVFQAQIQMYSTLVGMETSQVKVIGDTLKSVVTNMSS